MFEDEEIRKMHLINKLMKQNNFNGYITIYNQFKYEYYFSDTNFFKLYIIEMEQATDTLSSTHEKVYENSKMPFEKTKQIFEDLIQCLLILHRNKVCHFDIKLANIFFMRITKNYFLCDFGGTQQFESLEQNEPFLEVNQILESTPHFHPPEIDLAEFRETQDEEYFVNPYKFDIYSLGMSIAKLIIDKEDRLEMEQAYVKARKWKSFAYLKENVEILQAALQRQLNSTQNPEEKKYIQTIKNMTSFSYQERPSIYEIALSHT